MLMTKFKIIRWALKLFISCQLLNIVTLICVAYEIHYDISIPSVPVHLLCFNALLSGLFTVGLYFIHQSCNMFLIRGYFNLKSALYLNRGGYILMAVTLLSLIKTCIYINPTKALALLINDFGSSIIYDIMFLIVGLSLVALSDIIKEGEIIKTENDLTL